MKRLRIKTILVVILSLTLWSCGDTEEDKPETVKETDIKYNVLAGSSLVNPMLYGTGSVRFFDRLQNRGRYSFDLSFRLEVQGQINLVFLGNDDLSGGVRIRVTRRGNLLDLNTELDGHSSMVQSVINVSQLADETMRLSVHVDNKEDSTVYKVYRRLNRQESNLVLVFDSEVERAHPRNVRAKGVRWGLTMSDAMLVSTSLGTLDKEDRAGR